MNKTKITNPKAGGKPELPQYLKRNERIKEGDEYTDSPRASAGWHKVVAEDVGRLVGETDYAAVRRLARPGASLHPGAALIDAAEATLTFIKDNHSLEINPAARCAYEGLKNAIAAAKEPDVVVKCNAAGFHVSWLKEFSPNGIGVFSENRSERMILKGNDPRLEPYFYAPYEVIDLPIK